MSEETDLGTHVSLCHLRYKQLETRMDKIENDLDEVRTEIKELRDDMQSGFADLKHMLVDAKDEKFKIMVGAASTVIVGLLGMLGYLITHLAGK